MQAMPTIPTDIQAPPARSDRPAPADRDGSGFRDHLKKATGRHRQARTGDDDGRKPVGTAPETATSRTDHRHRTDSHRPDGREKHSSAEATDSGQAAAAAAEKDAEQTAASAQAAERQQGSSMAALLAALTGDESGRTLPAQTVPGGTGSAAASGQAGRESGVQLQTGTRAGGTAIATPALAVTPDQAPADTVLTTPAGQAPADTILDGNRKSAPAADRAEITVDHWSATFSRRTASGETGGRTMAAASVPAPDSTIGQTLVSVQRIPDNEEIMPPAPAGARAPQVDTGGQRQDINSSYIHANLPNQTTRGDAGNGNGRQPGADRGQDGPDLQAGSDQIRQQGPTETGSQPLVFSLDQAGGIGSTGGQQTTTGSVPLHQTAGLPVSDTHVMDQVIQRLGGDRQLESGTVVLRLHPQELGELRMEIKVEQDNIKAHITTNNPQVQDILDRHLPRLRDALEQQGLNLEQMQVTVAAGDNSNTQLFQEHRSPQRHHRSVQNIGTARSVFSMPEDDDTRGHPSATDDLSLSIHA